MSLVFPLTRKLVFPLVGGLVLNKAGGPFPRTEAILGAGGDDFSIFDFLATDRLINSHRGRGAVPADGNTIGLAYGREKQGRKSLADVMAGQPNLITNGGFDTDLAGWTPLVTGSAPAAGWDNGRAFFQRIDSANYSHVNTTFPTVIGKLYQLRMDITDGCVLQIGSTLGGTQSDSFTLDAGVGALCVFVAVSTTTYLRVRNVTNGGVGYLDNVSCREFPGHYARQANTAARAVYVPGVGALFDNVDDNLGSDWTPDTGPQALMVDLTVPPTLPASSVAVALGLSVSTGERWWMGIQNASGQMRIGAGTSEIAYGPDLRGQRAIMEMSWAPGEDARIYLNGALMGTRAITGIASGFPVAIGARNQFGTPNLYFNGHIRKAALGKKQLTDAQALALYNEWINT
jgi:hypothetical protein